MNLNSIPNLKFLAIPHKLKKYDKTHPSISNNRISARFKPNLPR